jgi:DMSO/TMAO reductase YedYZ molybdopterin-dependent catalytic subunit
MTTLDDVSPRSRIAEPGEGISLDELRLAARNHGMPLEALDLDVTPPGMHYLLTHYDIPFLDPRTWRLTVDGHVERPLVLDLAGLAAEPSTTRRVTFECAGNGRAKVDPRPVSQPWLDEAVGTAEWTGVPLAGVLDRAGVRPGAVDVVFSGADHGVERGVEQDYQRALSLADATARGVMLVHTMNGGPLPPQHGAPLRLVVPGWYGMTQVKWLTRITVLDEPFTGYQNATAYRVTREPGDPGEPVRLIQPKALLRPPGFPDFQTRARIVDAGVHELTGRAWSGEAPVARVDVSVDAGASWHEATLDPPGDRFEWRRWRWSWTADRAGLTEIWVRATDEAGNVQPLEQRWNRQAMANNHVQRTRVLVR